MAESEGKQRGAGGVRRMAGPDTKMVGVHHADSTREA
ncbi:hypothetical protein BCF44_102197 [Kutzneria buriramensis]|uniref:Uncharacterized protein n=1 Tax=Kutzneria buriramensis TaxID=1045776 RepID=A0A3E0I5H6_9PSEU|nr:hypothetical protein BCF44_102197 [Kutzneria buriramensis]